ncbi:MAG TPA: class I SAM-dependent methyltransferase [Rhizomicrobium sp.]|nr:class I SAM-dependent methyltransferase [Rhizomicrobium sp.]
MSFVRSAKEAARHFLHRNGLGSILRTVRNWRGEKTGYLDEPNLRDRFSRIYREEVWIKASDAPASGEGSSLRATENLRAEMPKLFSAIGVQSILDVGCGDLTWIMSMDLPQTYTGIDIVPSVIEANKTRYPDRTFFCLDATVDAMPRADMVICREVLFHLSFADGRKVIENLKCSGTRYFLQRRTVRRRSTAT